MNGIDWCATCQRYEAGWPVCTTCGASTKVHDQARSVEPQPGSRTADDVEARFAELISTELDHYAQKIAKRVLRKALGGKITERSSAANT